MHRIDTRFTSYSLVLAVYLFGCGSSPVSAFKQFVANEDKESSYQPGKKIPGSDKFDVRKTDSLTAPYIGIHEVDVRLPVEEQKGIKQPVKTQKTVRFEFTYRGDGKKWEADEAYITVVAYDVLQDDQGIGETTRKAMLGKRVRIQ
jgi:hypothetical protein